MLRDQHVCLCPVVFSGFSPHVCSQDPQEVSPTHPHTHTPSNLISTNFEGIQSFLFIVEAKAYPLPQDNTYPSFHFKVKTFLKHISWFNSAASSIIYCFSAAVILCSLTFKKFKIDKALYKIQTPCVTIVPIHMCGFLKIIAYSL